MNKTMTSKMGNYEIIYKLERENGFYYITVEEKENSNVVKMERFQTLIDVEEVAVDVMYLLCKNQVGAVHVEDVLNEMGCGIE